MTDRKTDDGLPEETLDALFAEARAQDTALSDGLMARIMQDAETETRLRDEAERAAMARRRDAGGRAGGLLAGLFGGRLGGGHGVAPSVGGHAGGAGRLIGAIGGVPALAGLVMATVAGLWIGIAPPAPIADSFDAIFGSSASSSEIFEIYYVDNGSVLDFSEPEG